MKPEKGPQVYSYNNYREYLRDTQTHKNISLREFSRISGFRSSNMMKFVMDGDRNLSALSIDRVAKAVRLNRTETDFFRNLVLLNQSRNSQERATYAERLVKSPHYRRKKPDKKLEFEYFSKWYLVAIRELVATKGFKEDSGWIAERITPHITPSEAQNAIEDLLELGLIKRQKGKLVHTGEVVKTDDELVSLSLPSFHEAMIKKGLEAQRSMPKEDRNISCVTVALTKENAEEIKSLIHGFREEILKIANGQKTTDEVYQANFQFFPLSSRKD